MALLRRFTLCFSLILLLSVVILNSVRQQAPLEMIAFACCNTSETLYRIEANGENLEVLFSNKSQISQLNWSPNGKWIAYVGGDNPYRIFRIMPNGHRRKGLTLLNISSPIWSPNSRSIAYLDTGVVFLPELYITDFETQESKYLQTFQFPVFALDWVEESLLVFMVDQEGSIYSTYEIRLNSLDTSSLRLQPIQEALYLNPIGYYARWSPDGQRLAFSEKIDEYNTQIAKMRPDGSDYQMLASGGMNRNLAWSNDGKWIAFTSDRENLGQPKLYKMRADGSDVQKVSDMVGVSSPAWSPKFDIPWHRNELAGLGGLLLMAFAVLTRVKLRSEQV